MMSTPDLLYRCFAFEELTSERLYDILKIRQEVFVVEQECAYLDCDGYDQAAHHLIGFNRAGEIVNYARLIPPGTLYGQYASFGRVLVVHEHRNKGYARSLTEEAEDRMHQLYGAVPIKIMAQTYLVDFYASHGFTAEGNPFLEDGIKHQYMIKT